MSRVLLALLVAIAGVLVGCSKSAPAAAAAATAPAQHEHKPPHGGTPVELGEEAYHLELVREADTGKLTAYVLDGEMEEFIRVKAPTFEMVATVGGVTKNLTFHAVVNAATGETVGNTSQFEAQADWLKTTATFEIILTAIEIKGTVFAAVAAKFPGGNDKE